MKSISQKSFSAIVHGAAACVVVFAGLTIPAKEAVAQVTCFAKMPTAVPFITSNYGVRKHPKLANTTRLHKGSDLRAPTGTNLFAVESGIINFADYSSSAGNMIILLAPGGKQIHYFHLNRIHVKRGDSVTAGQIIGAAGNTGNTSAAPHLHFEVRPNANNPVDPRPYLCNPPEKAGAGPDPLLNPNATPGGSTVTNGIPNNDYPAMGSSPVAAVAVPQASSLPNYSGMSVQEFLATESERRFGNPQWYRDINDPLDSMRNHPDPQVQAAARELPIGDMKPMLLKEMIFMMNVKDFFAIEERDRRERIEQMLATDLADRVDEYSKSLLQKLRQQASSLAK